MWSGITKVYGMKWGCEFWVQGQIIKKHRVVRQVCNDTGTVEYIYVFKPTKVSAHHDLFGTTSNFAFGIH
jgi:hypothetical protein